MERGEFQIPNSEIAKEEKAKLYSIANNTHEGRLPEGPGLLVLRAIEKKDRLEAIVNETPALKEYLDRGGRVSVTREWLPRLGRARQRISLTNEGLVIGRVHKGGNEFPLTGNTIAAEASSNGAIEALSVLPYKKLFKRVARRIDPDTMRK
jgi:hypothetical protein